MARRPSSWSSDQSNAFAISAFCSTSCTFDEPAEGAAIGRRETTCRPERASGNFRGRFRPKNGHAPWFSGSSWTHATCVAFVYRSSAATSFFFGSG